VKNITVAVPEDVYRRARIAAAERGTSVSALVAEWLASLDANGDFERRLRREIELRATIQGFSAGERHSRPALHRRRT